MRLFLCHDMLSDHCWFLITFFHTILFRNIIEKDSGSIVYNQFWQWVASSVQSKHSKTNVFFLTFLRGRQAGMDRFASHWLVLSFSKLTHDDSSVAKSFTQLCSGAIRIASTPLSQDSSIHLWGPTRPLFTPIVAALSRAGTELSL